VPVKYLGIWDTVKAAGFLRWEITWPFTRELPNALNIRHAVAINERRAPFREYLVDTRMDGSLEEVWFAGVHSDVGGTFVDSIPAGEATHPGKMPSTPRLSTIALKWIIEGGMAEGLLVTPRGIRQACTVTGADAIAELHHRGWAWVFLGTRKRKVPAGASVHASVNARAKADPTFKAPANVLWVDPDWMGQPVVPASNRAGK